MIFVKIIKKQMSITRKLEEIIKKDLFKEKIIIIYGARRVGKTTLAKKIANNYKNLYLNADEPDVVASLTNKTSTELKDLIGSNVVVIDEAQRVQNIGITLKLLIDNFPKIQIIATRSSSFDLSNKILEPLIGRSYTHILYPISCQELVEQASSLEEKRLLEQRLIYGSYPDLIYADNKEITIKEITNSYYV